MPDEPVPARVATADGDLLDQARAPTRRDPGVGGSTWIGAELPPDPGVDWCR